MADVTIMGAGIFGLSIAWSCVQRGAKVCVVDPNGVAAGSSGGIVGALAPHVPENWNQKKQFQFESLLMASQFWATVAEVAGQDPGYARAGRIQPILDGHALTLARARQVTAKALWGDAAEWEVVSKADPSWLPNSPTGFWIHDTLSAHLHPKTACLALARALERLGVPITPDSPSNTPVVWATGWDGLQVLNAGRSRTVGSGVKGQAALLQADFAGAAQLFADGVHIVPHLDGTVAVGSTSENTFNTPDETDAQLDQVISKARSHVPALRDKPVLARWAGIRPRARSRAPMLGAWPGKPGHYIANGGFKIGFGMAPKVGEVMADLILEGKNTIPDDFAVEASF